MAGRFSVPEVGIAQAGANAGQMVGDTLSGLLGDFAAGQEWAQGNRIRGARQSLSDLGQTPDGGLDYGAASQRLLTAGDIKGAQALADLGLAQEDRKFRQMQYGSDAAWREKQFAAEQANRQQMIALQRAQLSARAPDTTTMYDPGTGGAQTGAWNPQTRQFEPIGGVKAPSASAAPRTTTIYDPQTGQPQTAQWDANAGDWKPIGGVKQMAPRPVPAAIQKAEADDLQDVQTIGQVNNMLGGFVSQLDTGALTLGPLENVQSRVQNWAGSSSPNSRNYASFTAGLEKMRNESLRLNKGVQTEGDAVRAWNEVFSNINDPAVVKQRLQEIIGFNNAAAQFKANQIRLRRETNGLDPLDVSGMVSVPGKDNGRVPQGTPQQRSGAQQFTEGQTARNQQTGETLVFRGGQWVPAR